MDSLVALYAYMLEHKDISDKISLLREEDFFADDILLSCGISIILRMSQMLANIDKRILIGDKIIYNHYNQFFSINSYFINKFKDINGYLVYDYLNNEYSVLFNRVKFLLGV